MRQWDLGELRRSATASRPDIRARLDQLAERMNSLHGSDMYRPHDLIKTAKDRQDAKISKCASGSHPSELSPCGAAWKMRARGEKVQRGARALAG